MHCLGRNMDTALFQIHAHTDAITGGTYSPSIMCSNLFPSEVVTNEDRLYDNLLKT